MLNYVLTALDTSGDTTWSSPGGISGWTMSNNTDVFETFGGNVGIGTFITNAGAALSVMNGNVGIGTWVPSAALSVGANAFTVNSNGFITATTGITTSGGYTQSGTNVNTLTGTTAFNATGTTATFTGNIGIGTTIPTAALAVGANAFTVNSSGTITATTGITTTGSYTQSGNGANTLTGTTAFNATGTGATFIGNVGIGTTTPAGGLAVMNGNVGIGTWVPGMKLDVNGTIRTASFIMSGQNPMFDYILTATDTNGDTTWSSVATVSGWTITNSSDLYETSGGNVGIGTTITNAGAALSVMNGNVGIGTWVPGKALDVIGTVRTQYFTMSGQNPEFDYILTATDTSGDTTWASVATVSGWTTTNLADVYETSGGNVGIGTTITNAGAALSVMNGNVGIGTWVPGYILNVSSGQTLLGGALPSGWSDTDALMVKGTARIGFNDLGSNVDILTLENANGVGNAQMNIVFGAPGGGGALNREYAVISALRSDGINPGGAMKLSTNDGTTGSMTERVRIDNAGNVGIGFTAPGQKLDVNGTTRTTYFTMSGQVPMLNYVLTATDTSGDTTWSSPGGISGWTITNNTDVYETSGGNVGIGTTITNAGAALSVMNGNVGIGTWVPRGKLDIEGTLTTATFAGNVGIGTWVTNSTLSVMGSMAVKVVTQTGSYSATASDNVILVNAAGAVVISLPPASTVIGREYIIKKTDGNTGNPVTITPNSGDHIDGQTSVTTTLQYQSYTIISDGSNWNII